MAEDLWFLQDWEVYAHNRDNHSTTIIWFWGMYVADESKICSCCKSLEGCSEFPPLRQQSLGKKTVNKSNQHCKLEWRKSGTHPSIHTLPRYRPLICERCCPLAPQGQRAGQRLLPTADCKLLEKQNKSRNCFPKFPRGQTAFRQGAERCSAVPGSCEPSTQGCCCPGRCVSWTC